MKRKTVNSILKGVAGVGLTLGGVSALSDANLVFANELETSELGTPGEEVVVETAKSDYEIARQEHLDKQPDATCTMNTVADAMIKAAEDAQESADDATATGEEGSKRESELGGEGTLEDQGERIEELEKPDEPQKPEEPQKLIDLRNELNAIVTARKTENGGSISGTQYYTYADGLVKEMIQYYADVEGFDGSIEFSDTHRSSDLSNGWVSNGIGRDGNEYQNYLETTYKDKDGNKIDIIYYDYVNANDKGDWLIDNTTKNNAELIDHIIIVEKAPVFTVDDNNDSFTFNEDGNFIGKNDSFTFVRDEFRNIVAYIIDGEKIEVKVDDNGERFIADSENEDGSVVTTTVTRNDDFGYTVTKTQTVKKADGTEEKTTSEKKYKELKGFSSGKYGKGEVYKTDLPKEPEKEPETPDEPVVTEDTDYTYTPGPSEPSTPASPQPETPETEIEDEDVPLADVPDVADEDIDTDDDLEEDLDEDVTDLEDEDVPLAVLDLDEPVDIPDADVPLSDNPETGDALTATWIGTAAASVAGLFGASRKKRKG